MDACVQKLVMKNAQVAVNLAHGDVDIINAIGNVLKYVIEVHAKGDAKQHLDAVINVMDFVAKNALPV